MTRKIWILVLAFALGCFVGGSAFLFATWIAHRHMPPGGWLLAVSAAILLWIAFGYARFTIREARAQELAAKASRPAESLGDVANMGGTGAAAAAHDLGSGAAPLHG